MRPIPVCLFLAGFAAAQSPAPPAFEVASVKINQQFRPNDRSTWRPQLELSPGSLIMRNYSLRMASAWAYHVQYSQIAGPDWIDSVRYDILAKSGAAARNDDEVRGMLQALLADRFHMAVHRESREMEVLALLLPKGGHKMKESDPNAAPGAHDDPARGRVIQGVTLQLLLDEWSRETNVPMIDMTGLKGRFDFSLNVQQYVGALRARVMSDPTTKPPADDEARVMLFQDMVAGEMGLRLEPRKAPVEVVVIDRADKTPVEN
jgi:uncharacterized protein (TIGR03435 family)